MTRYTIVKAKSFVDLEKSVNEAIRNGYVPTGGPVRLGGDGVVWWGQAMILNLGLN